VSFVPTGVKGVDLLLDKKGIPKGYTVLVLGAPGSGKTTFGLQYLKAGVERGENGVYVSMDELPEMLMTNADKLGLGITDLVNRGKIAIVDASPIRVLPAKVKLGSAEMGRREFALATLITSVADAVQRNKASRMVIDPVSTLTVHFSEDYERRVALLDLLAAVSRIGCTTLLLSELSEPSLDRKYQFDEFITHGVIILTRVLNESAFTKVFSIEKMRGVAHDTQPHPYRIAEGGIEVFPEEQIL